MHLFGLANQQNPFFGLSVLEFLIPSNHEKQYERTQNHNEIKYKEIVGGSFVFVEKLWEKITKSQNFQYHLNAKVLKVTTEVRYASSVLST